MKVTFCSLLYNPISGPEASPIEECNEELVSDLSAEELFDAIKSLKSGKAAGIDEIRPEMLESMGEKGMHRACKGHAKGMQRACKGHAKGMQRAIACLSDGLENRQFT